MFSHPFSFFVVNRLVPVSKFSVKSLGISVKRDHRAKTPVRVMCD